MRRDQGWCEDPSSPRYNRPLRLPDADCTDRMWRNDHLYDLTFVIDQNFSRRAKGRGSAIFFHLARPGLTPTAGCVAISAADMRKLAPVSRAARSWRSEVVIPGAARSDRPGIQRCQPPGSNSGFPVEPSVRRECRIDALRFSLL